MKGDQVITQSPQEEVVALDRCLHLSASLGHHLGEGRLSLANNSATPQAGCSRTTGSSPEPVGLCRGHPRTPRCAVRQLMLTFYKVRILSAAYAVRTRGGRAASTHTLGL